MSKSDDLISRQAAIAVADFSDYVGLSVDDVKKVTDEVVKGLKQLPSAQPENDWIPVTKKAHPDEEGEYLVTDKGGGLATLSIDDYIFCDDGTSCWLYSQNVVAWKLPPEPYTERREK